MVTAFHTQKKEPNEMSKKVEEVEKHPLDRTIIRLALSSSKAPNSH